MNIFELICVKAWSNIHHNIFKDNISLLPCPDIVCKAVNESLSRKTFPGIGNTMKNYQTKSLK